MADASTTPAPSPTAPPAVPPQPVVAENGWIYGIDGMLDQICGALARQGRSEWLPVLQQDRKLQATIGAGIGREVAKPLWVIALLIAGYAGYKIWTRSVRVTAMRRSAALRTNPSHYRRSRRSRRIAPSLRT